MYCLIRFRRIDRFSGVAVSPPAIVIFNRLISSPNLNAHGAVLTTFQLERSKLVREEKERMVMERICCPHVLGPTEEKAVPLRSLAD